MVRHALTLTFMDGIEWALFEKILHYVTVSFTGNENVSSKIYSRCHVKALTVRIVLFLNNYIFVFSR